MSALDYLFMPAMAVVLISMLIFVLRWAHRAAPGRGSGRPLAGEHGMLVPVTTVRDQATAARMVVALRTAGLSVTTTGPAHDQLLLVWPGDAAAARDRLLQFARESG